MHETSIVVIGNAVSDIRTRVLTGGQNVATFRLANTPRWPDKASNRWIDGPTSYYTVTCWRALADNVVASIHKGDPVVVTGRQRIREWTDGERSGKEVEIDAMSVGHDLSRGRARFERVRRGPSTADLAAGPADDDTGAPSVDDGARPGADGAESGTHAAA